MRTETISIYKFDELSDDAKKRAIEKWRNDTIQNGDYWFINEANNSLKVFCELFNVSYDEINYEQPYRNRYSVYENDEILSLSGQRLATWIWNNYSRSLFKGKYYSLWSKKDKNPHYTEKGSAPWGKLKSRHSKIMIEGRNCVLTGAYYDDSLLNPFYDFLDKPDNRDLSDLIEEAITQLCNDVESEIEYTNTDEAIEETIIANEYEFTENGEIY